MVTIRFPDRDAEKRALGVLLGRFSGCVLQGGDHQVPHAALAALTEHDIPFAVGGPTTHEQDVAAVRGPLAPPVQ